MKISYTPEYYYPYIRGAAQLFTPLTSVLLRREHSVIGIPFDSEGFRFAAAENMAPVVPVISSQQGALNEVVCERYMAMEVVASTAPPEALIKANNAQGTEKNLKQFPLERSVEQYLEMYKSL